MWLSNAHKILQKKYKKKHCVTRVSIADEIYKNDVITWELYVGDECTGEWVEAPTFKEALKKMRLHFHPKKVKSQNVQIKRGAKHGK